jgi:hypothetical protein
MGLEQVKHPKAAIHHVFGILSFGRLRTGCFRLPFDKAQGSVSASK